MIHYQKTPLSALVKTLLRLCGEDLNTKATKDVTKAREEDCKLMCGSEEVRMCGSEEVRMRGGGGNKDAWYYRLLHTSADVLPGTDTKAGGYSIRCLKD